MPPAARLLLFRLPGFLAGALAMLWLVVLFVYRLGGRHDVTEWQGLWPWALGLLVGGSFWAAIPDGFAKNPR